MINGTPSVTPIITCEYHVDGREFICGKIYSLGNVSFSSDNGENKANAFAKDLLPGTKVTVYYNPASFEHSFLLNGPRALFLLPGGAGILFILGAIWLIF